MMSAYAPTHDGSLTVDGLDPVFTLSLIFGQLNGLGRFAFELLKTARYLCRILRMSRCAAAVILLLMSTSSMLNFVSSVSLNFGFASAQILSFFSEINTSLSLDGVTRSEKRASRGRPPLLFLFSFFSLVEFIYGALVRLCDR